MPATSFPEYARAIMGVLEALLATGQAKSVDVQIDQRSMLRGFYPGHGPV